MTLLVGLVLTISFYTPRPLNIVSQSTHLNIHFDDWRFGSSQFFSQLVQLPFQLFGRLRQGCIHRLMCRAVASATISNVPDLNSKFSGDLFGRLATMAPVINN